MCVVSNVGDQFNKYWPNPFPTPQPFTITTTTPLPYNGPTKEQFEEFLELMRAAKKIDKFLGTPDCEMEAKMTIIRKVAEALGLDPKVIP